MTGRTYDGPALDGTVQVLGEAPHWQDGVDAEAETVEYATDPEPEGEERTVGEPVVDRRERNRQDGSESAQDSNSRCRDRVRGSSSRPRNGGGSRVREEVGDPGQQANLSDFGGGER